MSLGDILALKNKAQLNDMTNRIKNRITKDLSTLLQQHGKNIVITGDSLSFNRYDFDATFRTNAYDCMPGMQSWSFMLRDAIHRNDPYFTSAEDTIWGLTSATATFGNFSSYYGLFNNRGIDLTVKNNSDEFRIYVKQKSDYNQVVLYMQKLPNSNTCKFDIYVDGVLQVTQHDNKGNVANYLGYEPDNIVLNVPADNTWHEIKLTNFVQSADTPNADLSREIAFYGWGTKLTNVYLTGHGGWKAGDLLTEWNSRCFGLSPDLVFLIIGANDGINGGTPIDTFKANVQTMINQVKAVKPLCEIVLMSCTDAQDPSDPNTSNASYVPRSLRKLYADALYDLAILNDCNYIDTFNLFNNIPITEWRYDNVHMKKYGNTILAKEIVSKLIPQSLHDKKMLASNLRYGFLGSSNFYKKNKKYSGEIYFSWNGSAFVIDTTLSTTDADGFIPISSIVKTNDYTITVNLKTFLNLSLTNGLNRGCFSPKVVTQYGALTGTNLMFLNCKLRNLTSKSFDINLIKLDGNVTDATTWTNNTNLQFCLAF